jgi:hypothetical protein
MAVMSPGGLEGVADVDPYGIQWQAWRRPVPACFTASELLPQCPAWGCTRGAASCRQQWQGWHPAGLTSRPGPAMSRESISRVWPAPLRGLGALAVQE